MNGPTMGRITSFYRSKCRTGICRTIASAITLVMMLCSLSSFANAQFRDDTLPTASRAGDLQLGGGVIFGNSNYNFTNTSLAGGSFYTTFDIRSHLGAEANFRQANASSGSSVYQRTYEFGPRVYLDRNGIAPYAKVLYGRGVYNFQNGVANVAYNMYTFGGGMDFLITNSLNVRADYEYQSWVGFPLGTLHPSVVMLGVAFHFHE